MKLCVFGFLIEEQKEKAKLLMQPIISKNEELEVHLFGLGSFTEVAAICCAESQRDYILHMVDGDSIIADNKEGLQFLVQNASRVMIHSSPTKMLAAREICVNNEDSILLSCLGGLPDEPASNEVNLWPLLSPKNGV